MKNCSGCTKNQPHRPILRRFREMFVKHIENMRSPSLIYFMLIGNPCCEIACRCVSASVPCRAVFQNIESPCFCVLQFNSQKERSVFERAVLAKSRCRVAVPCQTNACRVRYPPSLHSAFRLLRRRSRSGLSESNDFSG